MIPTAAGNLPGPQSLMVALLEAAGPYVLGHATAHPAEATALGGGLIRSVRWAADLSDTDTQHLRTAVSKGEFDEAHRVMGRSNFMNSPLWGALLGIINLSIFVAAVRDDEADTVTRWTTIINSGAGTILSMGLVLKACDHYMAQRAVGILEGTMGKTLGVIAGVAAVVASLHAAQQEAQTGDQTGMWLNVVGAGGAALSVAGFLLGTGVVSSATGIGAPVGLVLVIAGTVIGLAAGLIALWRELTTAASHRVFEAFVNHLQREGGDFHHVVTLPAQTPRGQPPRGGAHYWQLRSAYMSVRNAHHQMSFWDISPTDEVLKVLFALTGSTEMVASMVSLDEAAAGQRLRALGLA
jgi:hypothetical protein